MFIIIPYLHTCRNFLPFITPLGLPPPPPPPPQNPLRHAGQKDRASHRQPRQALVPPPSSVVPSVQVPAVQAEPSVPVPAARLHVLPQWVTRGVGRPPPLPPSSRLLPARLGRLVVQMLRQGAPQATAGSTGR